MIKRLKFKFIILSAVSLFVLLLFIVVGMNLINYRAVVKESEEIISVLADNKGSFPDIKGDKGDKGGKPQPHYKSPEIPYESRYFSVLVNEDGEIVNVETSKIVSVNTPSAMKYAEKVLEIGKSSGFIDKYRFSKIKEGNGERITFLDCRRSLDSFLDFLYASLIVSFAGYVAVIIAIIFFAGRLIRPIAESYEKQKRFITDAGHELKTPLTIINANVDVLEMDLEENESLEDIKAQTKRLTSLTNDLVLLSRMEESEDSIQMIDFPISEVVEDTAKQFVNVALSQDKNFTYEIEPMLTLNGNDKAIEKLVTILLDNAVKYTENGGEIKLILKKLSKNICLSVHNTTNINISNEDLNRVFDRFYRTDLSRNSETGGHGIGLSIAKAIVTAHNGKIQATNSAETFDITVILPIK